MMDTSLDELPALGSGENKQPTAGSPCSSTHNNGVGPRLQSAPTETTLATKTASSTPQPEVQTLDQDRSPLNKRSGLRLRGASSKVPHADFIAEAMKPLTDEERQNWEGWVELESDPLLFNFILREYGVADVKIQEVYALDDSLIELLPKPIYGLIFLYRYIDDEEDEGEEYLKCPKYVWFANQTTTNACATLALLNIVMNVPDLTLGRVLSKFKEDTRRLKPPYRGQSLGCNTFIRNIHNSFARRMDILNADLALSNEMEKWKRAKNSKRKNTNATKKKKIEEDEPGYHYIAYVPINGVVWKLDGLRRQPVNIGEYQQDWLPLALGNIEERILQSKNGVDYSLLSVCQSPLRTVLKDLAENIGSISSVANFLTTIVPDWRHFTGVDDPMLIEGPDTSFGISQDLLDKFGLPHIVQQRIGDAGDNVTKLLNLYKEWATDQIQLRASYINEAASTGQDDEQARRGKEDFTSTIYTSIKTLSKQGILPDIVNEVCEK